MDDQILQFLTHLTEILEYEPEARRYTELDIEILNEEISCLCIGHDALGTLCIPFICENGDCFTPEEELLIWQELTPLLTNPTIKNLS